MVDDAAITKGLSYFVEISYVSCGKLDGESPKIAEITAWTDQTYHFFAASEQVPHKVRADETRSSRDENAHSKLASSALCRPNGEKTV